MSYRREVGGHVCRDVTLNLVGVTNNQFMLQRGVQVVAGITAKFFLKSHDLHRQKGGAFTLKFCKLPRRWLALPFHTIRGLASLKTVDHVLYVNNVL